MATVTIIYFTLVINSGHFPVSLNAFSSSTMRNSHVSLNCKYHDLLLNI